MEVKNPQSQLLKTWVNLTIICRLRFLLMSGGAVLGESTSGWRRATQGVRDANAPGPSLFSHRHPGHLGLVITCYPPLPSSHHHSLLSENRVVVAQGAGEKDGLGIWGWQMQTTTFRVDRHKVLMYSTGDNIQYPVINHTGKECKKRMCICV